LQVLIPTVEKQEKELVRKITRTVEDVISDLGLSTKKDVNRGEYLNL